MNFNSIFPLALAAFFVAPIIRAAPTDVLDSLNPAIRTATVGFDKIPDDRKLDLKKIALFVQSKIAAGEPAQITFILHGQQSPEPSGSELGSNGGDLL